MKNWLNINMLMVALAAVAMIGCETTTEPTDTPLPTPKAPTKLEAKSNNETSIGLRWTAATGDTVTPTGFLVEYNAVGSATKITLPVSGDTTRTATVAGLTEGTIYEFVVYAVNDTVKSAASPKVQWSPARRGEGVYRLYSSANASQGSGLGIFRAVGAPATLTISSGGEWDLCFDDKVADNPTIGSPGQSRYVDPVTYQFPNEQVAKTVYMNLDRTYADLNSLDEVYESSALVLPDSNGEKMLPLKDLGKESSANIAFVIGTRDEVSKQYNFAKVMLVKQPNGEFIQGSGSSSYVEVEISYQTVKNVPYAVKAKFDELMRNARSTPRKPARD